MGVDGAIAPLLAPKREATKHLIMFELPVSARGTVTLGVLVPIAVA
jgi:hypothetical protein